jgi:septal ring factor EnvC (AmiA/AmiB activator)
VAELTRARTLIDQADKTQAQRYAADDLQRARDELSQAETASNSGHHDTARTLAESAAVDADLASARAQAGEAEHAAQEATQGNRTLERETQRPRDTNAPAESNPTPAQDAGSAPPPPPPTVPPPPGSTR